MKNLVKNSIILVCITIVAGASLGLVYGQTKKPIEQAAVNKQVNAYRQVFAQADEFSAIAVIPDIGVAGANNKIEDVSEAKSGGQVIGYVITITNHNGYSGDITFSVGIKNDGTINGISLLKIAETPGLGMNAEDVLVPQYAEKKVEAFAVTKTSEAGDDKINAITGATITSNAITDGVNAALLAYKEILK